MPVSNKDQMRINLAAKRVERWNRERCKPAFNKVDKHGDMVQCRLRSIVFDKDQDKPAPVYPDKGVVACDAVKMRSADDKVARFMRRNGDNFSDYHDSDYSESPRDPVRVVREYRARPDSPFKRAQASAASVVIVRK